MLRKLDSEDEGNGGLYTGHIDFCFYSVPSLGQLRGPEEAYAFGSS